MDLPQMIDFIDWQVHFFDFAILGALQTDRFGNINTVCIGDHARPKLRGPGTVGISALCGLSRRFYIMMTRHDRSAFVPKVDFICGAGHMQGGTFAHRRRAARGRTAPGRRRRSACSTSRRWCKAMRIKSLHDGVTLDEARNNTGFDLIVPDKIERTAAAPTDEEELFMLRRTVFSTGVLARKFPWTKAH